MYTRKTTKTNLEDNSISTMLVLVLLKEAKGTTEAVSA